MTIKVPQHIWYGNTEMELNFPPSWRVSFCPMKGGERKKLTPQEMEERFVHPIGHEASFQSWPRERKRWSFFLMTWQGPLLFLRLSLLSSRNWRGRGLQTNRFDSSRPLAPTAPIPQMILERNWEETSLTGSLFIITILSIFALTSERQAGGPLSRSTKR